MQTTLPLNLQDRHRLKNSRVRTRLEQTISNKRALSRLRTTVRLSSLLLAKMVGP